MQSNNILLFDNSEGKTDYCRSMSLEESVGIMLVGFLLLSPTWKNDRDLVF